MAEKPEAAKKLNSLEWELLFLLWGGGDPDSFPGELWDTYGEIEHEVTDEEEALLVDLMARGYVDEVRPWLLTDVGKEAVLAGPMGHIVCWADKEGNFHRGEFLKLQWISEPLRQAFGTPDVPANETILRLVRGEVGDHLIARVHLLDDDQVTAKPVPVALEDLVLASELELTAAAEIVLREARAGSCEFQSRETDPLLARGLIRCNTAPWGTWVLTPLGEMALWWAATATKREEKPV